LVSLMVSPYSGEYLEWRSFRAHTNAPGTA